MHSAPTVSYPVGHSAGARRLLGGIWMLGAAGAIAACVQSYVFGWRQVLLFAVVLAAGVAARAGFRRATEATELSFDGRAWSITGPIPLQGARAVLSLDLQALLLVHLVQSAGGRASRWLWLDRSLAPARWADLRRALHARTTGASGVDGLADAVPPGRAEPHP